ncbi:mobile mystery protein B [Asticcacaulis excentricus]|uniref:Mobile mystery protein B n=1 Tax=Asticcacaulis excentricus (strain ATCC 15261 / DSM 4724 / KCTC 12464 / NCIMB 9791 / VKM B-1370 / CB 48) TaxID=573065 RepID=E8RLH4_ASTEC|nr:mobile mystery protein B [Asticcacaulis excentricus]ADU13718.1 mobile mystery protein B [Asticcacaulis excentricus CB 48]
MSDPLFEQDDAATPLTREERDDLIPSYITQRSELNEAEQANIFDAEQWAFKRIRNVLDEMFLKSLHKRMLGKVWRWAGKIRQTERNIGVEPYRIEMELAQLVGDVRYWVEYNTFPPDEIAARFHHRLVFIHPFPNGNGRHARLATDLLLHALGRERFTWGRVNLVNASDTRRLYIAALRAADNHDMEPLLQFVRS